MNRDRFDEGTNEPRMDRALRNLGSVVPEAGFEGRILDRLAAARLDATRHTPVFWMGRLPRFSRQALGAATACVLGFGIVAGSVRHSHTMSHGAALPALPPAGQGIGAASAVHPAAPASTPAPAGERGRGSNSGAASADRGRARILPHARKAPGAVPAPPAKQPSGDSH